MVGIFSSPDAGEIASRRGVRGKLASMSPGSLVMRWRAIAWDADALAASIDQEWPKAATIAGAR